MKKAASIFLLVSIAAAGQGQTGQTGPPASCKVLYSMIEEDTLHNVNQGLLAAGFTEKDGLKWLEKMYKKYPDVCYVAPGTKESIVFVIIASPAVYHGTRVQTETHNTQASTSGTITDDEGNSADFDANTTGTAQGSVAVPYDVNYSSFMLTIERKTEDGRFEPLRRFRIDGLYHWAYGISWGKGKHPIANVMEEAIQWVHDGGLNNPAQTVAQ